MGRKAFQQRHGELHRRDPDLWLLPQQGRTVTTSQSQSHDPRKQITMQSKPATILVTGGRGYLGLQMIRDLTANAEADSTTIRILDNTRTSELRRRAANAVGRFALSKKFAL